MRTFVPTCDRYYFFLRPFAYLHNVFWSEEQEVIVAGYGPLPFELPENFKFYSIDREMYPVQRWSDGVIRFLSAMPDPFFIWMLEDYWLTRPVDTRAVASLEDYLSLHLDVYRIDLTSDRLFSGCPKTDVGSWNGLDLFTTPNDCAYQNSIQACVYNKAHLLRLLRPGLTPAQFELEVAVPPGLQVLGTRQCPVCYTIAWGTGHAGLNLENIPSEHLDEMRQRGYLDSQPFSPPFHRA